jgi:hypothetical protein
MTAWVRVDPTRVGSLTLETLVAEYKKSFGTRILTVLVRAVNSLRDAFRCINEPAAENTDEQSGETSMHGSDELTESSHHPGANNITGSIQGSETTL